MSPSSEVISRRRYSTVKYKRRRNSTSNNSPISNEPPPMHRMLTGLERVEVGRVSLQPKVGVHKRDMSLGEAAGLLQVLQGDGSRACDTLHSRSDFKHDSVDGSEPVAN